MGNVISGNQHLTEGFVDLKTASGPSVKRANFHLPSLRDAISRNLRKGPLKDSLARHG